MIRVEGETIEVAAILYEGTVYSLPRPGRHCDVIRHIWEKLGDKPGEERHIRGETQGFVTSTGRFVRREPAMRIAKAAKQLTEGKFQPCALFSEDLW